MFERDGVRQDRGFVGQHIVYRAVGAERRLRVHHPIAYLNVRYPMANFTDDAGCLGAQTARQRWWRIEAATNIGVDIVDTDGFVFDLNFMFRRIAGRELNRLKHLRPAVF